MLSAHKCWSVEASKHSLSRGGLLPKDEEASRWPQVGGCPGVRGNRVARQRVVTCSCCHRAHSPWKIGATWSRGARTQLTTTTSARKGPKAWPGATMRRRLRGRATLSAEQTRTALGGLRLRLRVARCRRFRFPCGLAKLQVSANLVEARKVFAAPCRAPLRHARAGACRVGRRLDIVCVLSDEVAMCGKQGPFGKHLIVLRRYLTLSFHVQPKSFAPGRGREHVLVEGTQQAFQRSLLPTAPFQAPCGTSPETVATQPSWTASTKKVLFHSGATWPGSWREEVAEGLARRFPRSASKSSSPFPSSSSSSHRRPSAIVVSGALRPPPAPEVLWDICVCRILRCEMHEPAVCPTKVAACRNSWVFIFGSKKHTFGEYVADLCS